MKTSNYILIVFFIFLFGGVLTLFVAAKLHQTDNNGGLWLAKEQKLEPFSVIVAEPGSHFQLSTAEYPRILTAYQRPDSCKFPPYGIRNDTLFVFADTLKIKSRNPDIIYCKDIKSILAKEKAYLGLQDLNMGSHDTLVVKLNNAKIDFFYRDRKVNNVTLFLQAQESNIYLGGVRLKTLDVNIDRSKIYAWNTSIEHLSGSLRNQSEMQAATMERINVEVDSTSQFNIKK